MKNNLDKAATLLSRASFEIGHCQYKRDRDRYLETIVSALNELHLCGCAHILQEATRPQSKRSLVRNNLLLASGMISKLRDDFHEAELLDARSDSLYLAKNSLSIYGKVLELDDQDQARSIANSILLNRVVESVCMYVRRELSNGNIRTAFYYLHKVGVNYNLVKRIPYAKAFLLAKVSQAISDHTGNREVTRNLSVKSMNLETLTRVVVEERRDKDLVNRQKSPLSQAA